MALPAGMPEQEWKYYDFGANWSEFLKSWKSDSVQDVLFADMQNWCEHNAYFEPDGSKPKWKRGDPLWHLSRTDYWATRNMEAADEYIKQSDCFGKFKRSMEQQGRRFANDEAAWDAFHDICMAQIDADFAPRPDTLETLIMVMGGEFLYDALAATAHDMKLGEVVRAPDGMVLLPGKKLVFDHMSYFFDVVEGKGKPILMDDADYDEIVAEETWQETV